MTHPRMQKAAGFGPHWTWQYCKSAESSDQRVSATTSLSPHPFPGSDSTNRTILSRLTATSLSRDPHRVEHRLHRQHELDTSTGAPPHVHAQPMPIGIEDPVRLEQGRDAGAGGTGEELQKRGEVFGADALGGQRRVAQAVLLVWCGQAREVACWREGARGRGRVQRVHVAERRAE